MRSVRPGRALDVAECLRQERTVAELLQPLRLVICLIVSIGSFVPSRPQWDEYSISHLRESVNHGRVTAANTRENEGELNHHVRERNPTAPRLTSAN